MLAVTRRQRMLTAVVLLVGSATVVGAVFGIRRLALAGVATLATVAILVLLDVRVRQGGLVRRIRTVERAQKKTAGMSTSRQLIKRISAHERRVLAAVEGDRKSTRLNSSHVAISYAVFCLKQKNDET